VLGSNRVRNVEVATTAGSRARLRDRPPASIKVDSKLYTVVDMSDAGIVVEPYDGDLVVKQRFHFDLILPINDKDQSFRCEATITRLQNKRLIAKFGELRSDCRRAIQYVIAHRNAAILNPGGVAKTP